MFLASAANWLGLACLSAITLALGVPDAGGTSDSAIFSSCWENYARDRAFDQAVRSAAP
jgi:hypothetical protein